MKVVLLVGPTASGKSQLALDLAQKFGGAILNADSVQVYQDLLIGSAAPTAEEKRLAPHFFFQEVAPPARLTAGDYARRTLEILNDLRDRFPVVFLVGGTGFYLMALEKGMLPVEKADPLIQAELQAQLELPEGALKLHAELAQKDPRVGRRIAPADHYRLVRALELIRRTGRPLSEIEDEHRQSPSTFPYPLLKLGIRVDRDVLRERIEQRTHQMLAQGLLDEVRALVDRGFRDWEPLQSVGYKESLEFLSGEIPDRLTLEQKIVQNTMRLAKKQKTWFQRDPLIHWGEAADPGFFQAQIRDFLHPVPR